MLGLGTAGGRGFKSPLGPPCLCADFSGAPAPRLAREADLPAQHLQIDTAPPGGDIRAPIVPTAWPSRLTEHRNQMAIALRGQTTPT
ncbi:hypothetical protein NDU88_002798 [Pleurodeles waltl]|uniref:Uncharacterized protein n=1 Tax=Pleurodeles waltl TaxID=8319 RepID=A0AAV7SDX9_PLEWA|nr:hypothetical protein NDU88_002798 [Pleurodeles waltl]